MSVPRASVLGSRVVEWVTAVDGAVVVGSQCKDGPMARRSKA